MMAEDNVYSEQELSKMADELLSAAGETELIPEPPKAKKSSRKKEAQVDEAVSIIADVLSRHRLEPKEA